MLRRSSLWCFVLLMAVPATASHAQNRRARIGGLRRVEPEAVGLRSEELARIAPAVKAFIDKKEIAGAVTVVARRGRVAYARAFGKMGLESGKDMRLDTIFRIYSMTKPVTSVAVLMLYEEKKFDLDDPVSKHLPELKNWKVYKSGDGDQLELEPLEREVTIRDLLRHTAGLTYGLFSDTEVDKLYRTVGVLDSSATLKDMARKLGDIPLLYQPGTRWHYSVSVDVLGYLVEVVSGTSLDRFLEEQIFRPLGMKDTAFHVAGDRLERFAVNYGPDASGGLRVVDAPATSPYSKPATFFSGGGGLVSTAGDYLRFCQMLLNKGELRGVRILRPETVELMTRNQLPDEAMPIGFGPAKRYGVGFGLGVSVRVSKNPSEAAGRVGEYGWGGAASTHFWISPRDDLVVLAFSQYMPYSDRLERSIKPIVYEALAEAAEARPKKRRRLEAAPR